MALVKNTEPAFTKTKYKLNSKTGKTEIDPLSGMDKVTRFNVGGKEIEGGTCLTLWTDKKISPIISENSPQLSSDLKSHLLKLKQK